MDHPDLLSRLLVTLPGWVVVTWLAWRALRYAAGWPRRRWGRESATVTCPGCGVTHGPDELCPSLALAERDPGQSHFQ